MIAREFAWVEIEGKKLEIYSLELGPGDYLSLALPIPGHVAKDAYKCGVEMWRGGLGAAYLLPALSAAGASIASPCFRFHIPLVEPDVRISRFRLSEKGSR
jgi:hypothetical protein